MGKPLEIHVTDQQSFHPVMEHNFSPGTYPHIGGVPSALLRGTVPLVLYEEVRGPDMGRDPVLALDLRDPPTCKVLKIQAGVLSIEGKLSIVLFFCFHVSSTFHLCLKSKCVSNSRC